MIRPRINRITLSQGVLTIWSLNVTLTREIVRITSESVKYRFFIMCTSHWSTNQNEPSRTSFNFGEFMVEIDFCQWVTCKYICLCCLGMRLRVDSWTKQGRSRSIRTQFGLVFGPREWEDYGDIKTVIFHWET